MLGYVTPEKSELRLRENEVYGAYYCGLCRLAGKLYGQLPRLFLNFDFVFLAMLLSAVTDEPDDILGFRCLLHPTRTKHAVAASSALEHAVRMMLILSYYKSIDDKNDEGSIKAFVGERILRKTSKKINMRRQKKSGKIKAYLEQINTLERQKCNSFDTVTEPFALLMEEVFDFDELGRFYQAKHNEEGVRYALRRIGHYTGKWISLIDAYDDLEDDVKTGAYNPLLLNYCFKAGEHEGESLSDFKKRINERIRLNAMLYLSDISEVLNLLPIKKNLAILENIVYIGLRGKTEAILGTQGDGSPVLRTITQGDGSPVFPPGKDLSNEQRLRSIRHKRRRKQG